MEMETRKESNSSSPVERTKVRLFFENVFSLLAALVLVFMIRYTIIEAFKIPSGSMIPTLLVGDHIFVNKFAYDIRAGIDIPFLLPDLGTTLYQRQGPQRGDIIVFRYPVNEKDFYIKRVIGTPGDRVEVRNEDVYVNDQMISRDLLAKDKFQDIYNDIQTSNYDTESIEVFKEKFPDTEATVMVDRQRPHLANYGAITVPADQYFVMGDNRDYSNDSRVWNFVPRKNIKGKAVIIWFSACLGIFNDCQPKSFRPDRIATVLH